MLKKLALKVLMMSFVMFGLSTYAGYLITGRLPPFMDRLRGFLPAPDTAAAGQPSWSNIGALEHKSTAQAGNYEVVQGEKTVIYKWQDAKGHWQYGERAPSIDAKVTRQEIITASGKPAASAEAGREKAQSTSAANGELINPYSPEGVKELIDRAKQVRQKVEERGQEQQAQLNQM